jgi:predicted RNA polymerase sigma factor
VTSTPTPTHRAIETVWRIESARVIAHVARLVRDVGLAQESLHSLTARSGRNPSSTSFKLLIPLDVNK